MALMTLKIKAVNTTYVHTCTYIQGGSWEQVYILWEGHIVILILR